MLQKIKDHPDLIKDIRTGAILMKRPKTPESIKLDNLEKRVIILEKKMEEYDKLVRR